MHLLFAAAHQMAGWVIAYFALGGEAPVFELALPVMAGGVAAGLSLVRREPWWWTAIQFLFAPAVWLARGVQVAPGWYLAGFLLLFLVFRAVQKTRVPLYLTGRPTLAVLAGELGPTPSRVLDLGCGTGSVLVGLARARPDCTFLGVELAPIPFAIAWLRCLGLPNCRVSLGDFWRLRLAEFDLVYAFLSPVPMPRLWLKAKGEMQVGARLISNSFPVPEVEPDRARAVGDLRGSVLYCYTPRPAARAKHSPGGPKPQPHMELA